MFIDSIDLVLLLYLIALLYLFIIFFYIIFIYLEIELFLLYISNKRGTYDKNYRLNNFERKWCDYLKYQNKYQIETWEEKYWFGLTMSC